MGKKDAAVEQPRCPLEHHAPCCVPHHAEHGLLSLRQSDIASLDGFLGYVESAEICALLGSGVAELVLLCAPQYRKVICREEELVVVWRRGLRVEKFIIDSTVVHSFVEDGDKRDVGVRDLEIRDGVEVAGVDISGIRSVGTGNV